MRNIQKALYSKTGLKKWFFETFMKNSRINHLSMPKRIEDGIDYLNMEKKLWQHPAKNFKMSLSFIDLIELAKKEFNKLGKILLKAYNRLDYEKDLEKFIDNINHSGVVIGEEMKYSDPVF